jgi:hypothetical protein
MPPMHDVQLMSRFQFVSLLAIHSKSDRPICSSGGVEDWIVNCRCGTRDDDGERMVDCDVCQEWSHTRCAGYPDNAPLPDTFVCPKCAKSSARRSKKDKSLGAA